MTEVTVDTAIAAPAERVYDLVSDVTRMGQWSPETTSCRWLGDAGGPVEGARFRGSNRHGWRRWSTTCRVVTARPGEEFSFEVSVAAMAVSRWSYRFEPEGTGCRVSESWEDRRPAWMSKVADTVMGVKDRAAHNRQGMSETLDNLRRAAESAA